jgi:UDP:flavonoid glycosyltransferase YjiC (YdhE family)
MPPACARTSDDLGGGPFVLVALGTMFEERPEIFAACVAALRDRPETVVVAHGRTDPATIGEPGPRTVLRHVSRRSRCSRALAPSSRTAG